MNNPHPFSLFLERFVPRAAEKSKQHNQALWILETTGSRDAADLAGSLDVERRLLFSDEGTFKELMGWDHDDALRDPILKRQLNVLIRSFKENRISGELLSEIAAKEAALALNFTNFRPVLDGVLVTDNRILEILKEENSASLRKKAWEASKDVGIAQGREILKLAHLRNEAAVSLGYSDYFHMQLELAEVEPRALFSLLDELASATEEPYSELIQQIEKVQKERFSEEELGPWAWSDPFCQGDPIETQGLDGLVKDLDFIETTVQFFAKMGIDIRPTLERSDLLERQGKNQHAFCLSIDRGADVRTLNNVRPTIRWLETLFHEFGHAIYYLGINPNLPWLLREPPHMITTEAMALIGGRQVYNPAVLKTFLPDSPLLEKGAESQRRRQIIFSRFALVMTYFERELYRDPDQNLNDLWWSLVFRFQKVPTLPGREGKCDWAAKYHIGLSPVYYYSYLLGELFASSIEEALFKETGSKQIGTEKAGRFLQEKLFFPGNTMSWNDLIQHVTGKPLSSTAWIGQFMSI